MGSPGSLSGPGACTANLAISPNSSENLRSATKYAYASRYNWLWPERTIRWPSEEGTVVLLWTVKNRNLAI